MYVVYKVMHLLALAAWLGPAFGGYWLLITIGKNADAHLKKILERRFEQVVRAEHGAFLILLATGVALLHEAHWEFWGQPWFMHKMILVIFVVLIEIADYLVSNHMCQRLLESNEDAASPAWIKWQRLRFYFYTISVPLLFILVPLIMALAVRKM